ncbi:hypothetical protein BJ956_000599 [Arthrobacter psychrochitiniphilus]|nr:hypothetical protein [Arthrobacter psychrochitiniphilus]
MARTITSRCLPQPSTRHLFTEPHQPSFTAWSVTRVHRQKCGDSTGMPANPGSFSNEQDVDTLSSFETGVDQRRGNGVELSVRIYLLFLDISGRQESLQGDGVVIYYSEKRGQGPATEDMAYPSGADKQFETFTDFAVTGSQDRIDLQWGNPSESTVPTCVVLGRDVVHGICGQALFPLYAPTRVSFHNRNIATQYPRILMVWLICPVSISPTIRLFNLREKYHFHVNRKSPYIQSYCCKGSKYSCTYDWKI